MLHTNSLAGRRRQQGSVATRHAASSLRVARLPLQPGTPQMFRSSRNVAARWAKDQVHSEILSALHPAEVPGYHFPAVSPELEQVGAAVERKLIDIQDALKLLRDNQLVVSSMGPAEPRRKCCNNPAYAPPSIQTTSTRLHGFGWSTVSNLHCFKLHAK